MEVFVKIIFAAALVLMVAVLCTFPVMWGVNAVFTPAVIMAVFGVSQLGFIKAFWLSVLCSALFKSSGSSSSK